MTRRWTGVPRGRELARDAVESARAQKAITSTLVAVLAAVCFAILVTTGQAAASEAAVIAQIDSAGTRLIVLSDDGGNAGIQPDAPGAIAALSDVTWAFGLGEAVDVTNPALPEGRAAARALVGTLPDDLTLVRGRLPQPGEAIAGAGAAAALHLGPGLGTVQPRDVSAPPVGVVGTFEATGPLTGLRDVVLIATEAADLGTLRFVYALATDVTTVDRLQAALATSTPALHPEALTIEAPSGAIALRDVIAGRLGAASRQQMALIMGITAVIVAVTMLSATAARRRDFGRRRALGATRSALVAGLLLQTSIGTIVGITLGSTSGLTTLALTTGALPTWRFTAGVGGLALLLTLLAATPIAAHAAHRDPLRILRVP
ncbi:protein of unknown function DUF214 [Xylanimonas cellulosilytica DSM 15894]|uniref:ABC3 transporter permease C-terminal domain-containing protein n=1 Tax=Xylanimonas cellulosilytica (strain DSM 15894 / JCM 12276 / CECT 5975 / KCTC 9989 / LMG 20990 / NBRC 107835 / XIL07) TaxID=446471 RepID=D1BY41_XYLCX|nr:FtsX-like permease family protein [Xylanimonas cellulosilytica]ACZ29884.1 protein of unknown function DUF214 [Xylanimonas cellulosilytica DSM 15894]